MVRDIPDMMHASRNSWNDAQLHHESNDGIVWKELIATFAILTLLRHFLNEKVVYIYTDNNACKYMLINVRAKLTRQDF